MDANTLGQVLEQIETRRQELAGHAAQLRERTAELDAEQEALLITSKTLRAMADDLTRPPAPALPDGPAYQQIMDVFAAQPRPLRARELCHALDLPLQPRHIEGTRAKLKRLASLGFLAESEPGLFAPRGIQPRDTHGGQRT